jgi:hypothetical protein
MRLAMLLLCLGAIACARGEEASNQAATVENKAAAAPEVAASTANSAEPATARPSAQRRGLRLVANGLELTQAESSRTLAFGAAEEEVVSALVPVLGEPSERAANPDCPAGPIRFAAWRDRLTVNFQEGRFVGWSLETEGPSELRTRRGITVGSSRAELERAYRTQVQEGSLGQEFGAEELYGVLSGPEPNARIRALWAGTNCIFH